MMNNTKEIINVHILTLCLAMLLELIGFLINLRDYMLIIHFVAGVALFISFVSYVLVMLNIRDSI